MMSPHVILRVVSKVLIPLIIVYGFYVHFHGEYSPAAASRPASCWPRPSSCTR